ncbi:MAG: CARDB domain-containing protein [Acidobacteriota bacterium]
MKKQKFVLILLGVFFLLLSGYSERQRKAVLKPILLPDLTATTAKAPARLAAGRETGISPTVTVRNIGKAAASNIEVNLFITETKPDFRGGGTFPASSSDTLWIQTETLDMLGAGQSQRLRFSLPSEIPQKMTSRIYYFGVYVDPNQLIAEANENNNYAYEVIDFSKMKDPGLVYPIMISSLSQTFFWSSGSGREELNIIGWGYGSAIGSKIIRVGSVSLDSTTGIEMWTPTHVIMPLPGSLDYGQSHEVYFEQNGTRVSNKKSIFLMMDVTQLNPTTGASGITVNVGGIGFGNTQGINKVKFGSVEAVVSSWSNSMIVVQVPSLPNGSYPVYIEKNGSKISSQKDFVIIP